MKPQMLQNLPAAYTVHTRFLFDEQACRALSELSAASKGLTQQDLAPYAFPAPSGAIEFVSPLGVSWDRFMIAWMPWSEEQPETMIHTFLPKDGKACLLYSSIIEEDGTRIPTISEYLRDVQALHEAGSIEHALDPSDLSEEEYRDKASKVVMVFLMALQVLAHRETQTPATMERLMVRRRGQGMCSRRVVYRTVKIDLGEDRAEGAVSYETLPTGERRRRHWVRGHFRKLPGKPLIKIKGHWRGSLAKGLSLHDYTVTSSAKETIE